MLPVLEPEPMDGCCLWLLPTINILRINLRINLSLCVFRWPGFVPWIGAGSYKIGVPVGPFRNTFGHTDSSDLGWFGSSNGP